ncbi:MAG: tripartite tricarboxylate transporter TctB family protein [Oscillospiraceae bacterium]
MNTKRLVPLGTALVGLVFIGVGLTSYGFWSAGKGPTPGFVPIIISSIMVLVSVVAFIQSFREEAPVYPRENWLVMLGGIGIFAATFFIGLLPSVALYVVLWLKGLEKCSWKQTLIVLAIIMSIVIGAFVIWLQVSFPRGMILDLLMN